MRHSSILLTAVVGLLVTSLPAAAVPVTLDSQERYVRATYTWGEVTETRYAPDFGPFNEGVYPDPYPDPGWVYATQESTLGLTSTGHLYAYGVNGPAAAYVTFTFTVSEPVEYQFDASMSKGGFYDGYVSTWTSLRMLEGPIIFSHGGDMSLAGILETGTYTFEAWAGGTSGSQGGWGWGETEFALVLAPEPTNLVFLALGLMGACLHRRTVRGAV